MFKHFGMCINQKKNIKNSKGILKDYTGKVLMTAEKLYGQDRRCIKTRRDEHFANLK